MALNQQELRFNLSMRDRASQAVRRVSSSMNQAAGSARVFKQRLDGAAVSAVRLKTAMAGTAAQLSSFLGLFGVAASTIAGGFAVRTMIEFGDKLAVVRGVTAATDMQFARLRQTAFDMGIATRFTAGQAAEGMENLARAGFSVNQTIDAIGPTLNLASAGALDLGTAADLMTNIMSAFGIAASQSADVADRLAFTAANANTNVLELGEAMKFAASSARSTGVSLDETLAALAALADRGLKGSIAGTGIRTALIRMQEPSQKWTDALRQMGLTMEDVNTQTHSLQDVFIKLRDAGFGKNVPALIDVFGLRAGPSVLNLLNNLEKMQDVFADLQVDGEGFAERLSVQMQNNLGGAVRRLKSAFEGLILTVNQEGKGPFRSFIEQFAIVIRLVAAGKDDLDGIARDLARLFKGDQIAKEAEALNLQLKAQNVELMERRRQIAAFTSARELELGQGGLATLQNVAAVVSGVAKAAAVAGAALLALWTAGKLAAAAGFLLLNPWGLAITALTAVFVLLEKNKDKMVTFAGQTTTVGNLVGATFDRIKGSVTRFAIGMRDLFDFWLDQAFPGLNISLENISWQDFISGALTAVKNASTAFVILVDIVADVGKAIVATFELAFDTVLSFAASFGTELKESLLNPFVSLGQAMAGNLEEAKTTLMATAVDFVGVGAATSAAFQEGLTKVQGSFDGANMAEAFLKAWETTADNFKKVGVEIVTDAAKRTTEGAQSSAAAAAAQKAAKEGAQAVAKAFNAGSGQGVFTQVFTDSFRGLSDEAAHVFSQELSRLASTLPAETQGELGRAVVKAVFGDGTERGQLGTALAKEMTSEANAAIQGFLNGLVRLGADVDAAEIDLGLEAAFRTQLEGIILQGKGLRLSAAEMQAWNAVAAAQLDVIADNSYEFTTLTESVSAYQRALAAATYLQTQTLANEAEALQIDIDKQKALNALRGLSPVVLAQETAAIEAAAELKKKHISLEAEGVDTLIAKRQELARVTAIGEQQTMTLTEGLKKSFEEYALTVQNVGLQVKDVVDSALGSFVETFTDQLIKGKASWRDFAVSVISEIARIIVQLLVLKAVQATLGGPLSFLGFAQGDVAEPNAKGNAFASGGTFTNAIVKRPTHFAFANRRRLGVMGEAGPEAVMPLQRTPDGRLGVAAMGGGGGDHVTYAPVINITTAGSSGDAALDARNAEMMAGVVKAAVRHEIAEAEKRRQRASQRFNRGF